MSAKGARPPCCSGVGEAGGTMVHLKHMILDAHSLSASNFNEDNGSPKEPSHLQ